MKKLLLLLGTFLFFFYGCVNEHEEMLVDEVQQTLASELSRAGGDQVYDFLGYGYDATGEYFTEGSTRFQVIDVVSFQQENSGRVVSNTSKVVKGEVISGENAEDYTRELSISTNVGIGIRLFGGSVKNSFKHTVDYSSKYAIASYNWMIQHKRVALNADAEFLQNYLTNEFREDLETKDASYIISRYGTHILTNIILGGRLEIMYRSSMVDEKRKSIASAGVTASYAKIFNAGTDIDYNMDLALKNSEQKLTYRMIGGEPTTSSPATLEITSGIYPRIDISEWINSCTPQRMNFIGAAPGSLIPIYELVKDQAKRTKLQLAYNNYISNNTLEMPNHGTPFYRYYHNGIGDHFYCRAGSGYSSQGYSFERIECYIYTYQANGTVPLYRYYDGRNHHYTIDWLGTVWGGKYKFERIECYVYPTQVEGTVPIFHYYNGKDHFYTREWSGESCQGYNHQRIEFYAYPGEAYGIYFE